MMVPLKRVDKIRWEIPKFDKRMRVPGRVYADDQLIEKMGNDRTLEQAANVAMLPGIYKYSIVMPDGHQGYGFPIGGVAAFDVKEGVISPGGVGYDINCGVRLIRTNLREQEVRPRTKELVDTLFKNVPSGLGSKGRVRLHWSQLDDVLADGAKWAVDNGYGWKEDLEHLEEGGRMEGANPGAVSQKAKQRGAPQLGSLGSGNHFLEVQVVDKIFDERIAKAYDLFEGQVVVMVHTGSRGLGHQVASDYLRIMEKANRKYNVPWPDRELVSVPFQTEEGQRYFSAMKAAANFAWANRQMITHWVRESFEEVFKRKAEDMEMGIVYDVAHNIAKVEERRPQKGSHEGIPGRTPGRAQGLPRRRPACPYPRLDGNRELRPCRCRGLNEGNLWKLLSRRRKAHEQARGDQAVPRGQAQERARPEGYLREGRFAEGRCRGGSRRLQERRQRRQRRPPGGHSEPRREDEADGSCEGLMPFNLPLPIWGH